MLAVSPEPLILRDRHAPDVLPAIVGDVDAQLKRGPDGVKEFRDPGRTYAQLFRWFEEGKLKPHVSHKLDLKDAALALDLLRQRKSTGKVVLVTGRL